MNMVQQEDRPNSLNREYLTFSLGEQQYGVDILKVQEIRGWESPRELHDVPAYIKGVMDFRGVILPVIDLRIRFGFSNCDYTSTTVIIVLSNNDDNDMMGIVVDAVSDVLTVDQGGIKPSPDMGSRINTDYILGMVTRDDSMVMLMDSSRLINREDFEVAESALVVGS